MPRPSHPSWSDPYNTSFCNFLHSSHILSSDYPYSVDCSPNTTWLDFIMGIKCSLWGRERICNAQRSVHFLSSHQVAMQWMATCLGRFNTPWHVRTSYCYVNPLTPNEPYRGRTAPLTSKVTFYIFIQQIQVMSILNMVYILHFSLFKMQFVS